MQQHAEIMYHMDQKGMFFPVHEQPVMIEVMNEENMSFDVPQYKPVENRKALVNNQGQVMGINSTGYVTVTNEQVADAFVTQLLKSDVNIDDMDIECRYANNGARTMVHFRFPKHEISVRGDTSIMEIVSQNSYDGSWKYKLRAGALRFACLNGMLIGDWASAYSSQHNSHLSIEHAASKITAMLEMFESTPGVWEAMLNRPVTDQQAWHVIKKYNKHDQREMR